MALEHSPAYEKIKTAILFNLLSKQGLVSRGAEAIMHPEGWLPQAADWAAHNLTDAGQYLQGAKQINQAIYGNIENPYERVATGAEGLFNTLTAPVPGDQLAAAAMVGVGKVAKNVMDNPTLLRLKGFGLERDKKIGVGKNMGGTIYAHRNYENEIIPNDVLATAKAQLQHNEPDFPYTAIRYDRKSGDVAFIESKDFDIQDEPTVGRSFLVKSDGSTRMTPPSGDPLIWHHKWMWVKDDYPGFDVTAAKQRSIEWKDKLGKNKDISSRIGRKSYWDEWTGQHGLDRKEESVWDIGNIEQEYKSNKTSINASKLPSTFGQMDKMKAVKTGDVIVDIGGGRFDNAVKWAEDRGATLHIVDPFNRSKEHNSKAIASVRNGQANIATVNNVLNVIREPENRIRVIKQAHNALHEDGKAYFTIYEGNKTGVGAPSQKGESWQNNAKLTEYLEEIRNIFGDVRIKNGMIVATKVKPFNPYPKALVPFALSGMAGKAMTRESDRGER